MTNTLHSMVVPFPRLHDCIYVHFAVFRNHIAVSVSHSFPENLACIVAEAISFMLYVLSGFHAISNSEVSE